MKSVRIVLAAVIAVATSACASVMEGDTQTINVTTSPVAGANCALSNKRGTWNAVTPADVVVLKSQSTLKAVCTKSAWGDSTAYLSSTESAQAIMGAVLIWGVAESIVDGSTGAGNNYPSNFIIHMKPAGSTAQAPTSQPEVPVAVSPATLSSSNAHN